VSRKAIRSLVDPGDRMSREGTPAMKASHLLLVLFAPTCIAIPQLAHSGEMNVYQISSTPRLLLTGKIGDCPITMSLYQETEILTCRNQVTRRQAPTPLRCGCAPDLIKKRTNICRDRSGALNLRRGARLLRGAGGLSSKEK
jgi:hypothetical protein